MNLLRTPGICITVLCAALGTSLPAARPARPWKVLEAQGKVIGRIDVVVQDVFDLTKPADDTWIGRVADHLHASTHEVVIRRALLFSEGDKVNTRRIYETERLLRALPFLKDAHIEPFVETDGSVVARVRVRDAWTTQVNASFSSVGGQKTSSFGIDEKNFLGEGKSVSFDVSKDHERSTWGFTYLDPQFLGSRWTLMLQDQYLSDGMARQFALGRPFYALDTPWSTALTMAQTRTGLYLYDQGVQIYQAPFAQDSIQWNGAGRFAQSGDRVWRGGVLLQRQDTRYGTFTQTGPPDPCPRPATPAAGRAGTRRPPRHSQLGSVAA